MTRFVAVIDIGKTNAKVALVDLETSSEIAVFKTPNHVTAGPPYPHFEVEVIWDFILSGLKCLAAKYSIDAISVTTHGATAALVDARGNLVLPVLDYEFTGLDEKRTAYEAVRPQFDETGSPSLPIGLNLGAQIFWQAQTYPSEFAICAAILTYPQYWSYRLSGVMASETTSLGCHTDLWNPWTRVFSSLVSSQGWTHLFPKIQLANANLGPLLDVIAEATDIKRGTPVHCGIHDSNASLLPYLGGDEASFSVVSTGTWIISLSVGGDKISLDPERDTLVNVNANGHPTPTARFMGGREFDLLTRGDATNPDHDEIALVLENEMMVISVASAKNLSAVLPAFEYPHGLPQTAGARNCVASFYCALRTAECLKLIGALGPIYVEGPFAKNILFLEMLAVATNRVVYPSGAGSTGTSLGAALLAGTRQKSIDFVAVKIPTKWSGLMRDYANVWTGFST